jgi:hypothetical protein
VEQLVRTYEIAEKNIREGCRLIAESEKALTTSFSIGKTYGIDFRERSSSSRLNFAEPDDAIAHLREQIWHVLVERLEIKRMMSLAKAKELKDWLEKESGKENITTESVLGFFRYYVENLGTMLEEQVGEVYELLRPRNGRYKTNSLYEEKERVILPYWIALPYKGEKTIRSNWSYSDQYYALENVFLALDGRGSITKSYRTELESAVNASPEGETTYFRYRACLNGNLHLAFKRLDLVAKFNKIAGGRRLRKGADDAAA